MFMICLLGTIAVTIIGYVVVAEFLTSVVVGTPFKRGYKVLMIIWIVLCIILFPMIMSL